MLTKINKRNQNHSLFFLGLYLAIIICAVIILKDNIIVTVNDNLDSNIPIYKMIYDNGLFWTKDPGVIPFLGGDIDAKNYIRHFNLMMFIYNIMPTYYAYITVYVLSIVMSYFGFRVLARLLNFNGEYFINSDIAGLCGVLYGAMGFWPSGRFGFASLPWLAAVFLLLYKKRKWPYILLLIPFLSVLSFAMFALFIMFYLVLFVAADCFSKRRIDWFMIVVCAVFIGEFFLSNKAYVLQGLHSSTNTIKSLAGSTYQSGIKECLLNLPKAFFYGQYHYGSDQQYLIPFCCMALVYFNWLWLKKSISGKFVMLYDTIFGMLVFNALAYSFNSCARFRNLISFASGFSFQRFQWLSPFLWMIEAALILSHFCKGKYKILASIISALFLLFWVVDPGFLPLQNMYNELHTNYFSLRYHIADDKYNSPYFDIFYSFTWHEYYSEELFETIKKDIDYNCEWSVAYGINPAVLQYNGIWTLDGYYSNYSMDYHEQFGKLIAPELEESEERRQYWSNKAIRAYLYNDQLSELIYHIGIEELELRIDPQVFKDMGGHYVFSWVSITNDQELGLELVGRYTADDSPYTIYVYELAQT